jgi:hypothetical protein
VNFADHQLSAQSSIISFVEGSGKLGRLGDQSPGASSATLDGMFEFRHPHHSPFVLDPASGHQYTADACRLGRRSTARRCAARYSHLKKRMAR